MKPFNQDADFPGMLLQLQPSDATTLNHRPGTLHPDKRLPPPFSLKLQRDTALKVCIHADDEAPRRANGIAGKEPAKVDDIETIVQILSIDLKAHLEPLAPVDVGAQRSIDRKQRENAAACEVDAADDLWTILSQRVGLVSGVFERKA